MNSPLSPLCPTPSQVQPYLLGAHPSSRPWFLGLQSPNGFPGFRTHNGSALHSWYVQIFSAHLLQIPPTHPCRYPCPVPGVVSSSCQSHLFIMFWSLMGTSFLQYLTRSTRPIDAKIWKRLGLWIMFNIKISLYQILLYQRS